MIGDRENDIISAAQNNVLSVGVLWGYGSMKELSKQEPNWIVASVEELIQCLSKNFNRSYTHPLNKSKLPEFRTERLFLRGVELSDSESYEKNFVDYEVIQHLSSQVPWPYPKGGVKEFLETRILPGQGKNRWTWAIFLKEDLKEVIGIVDVWCEGLPQNRGFWLAKKHWGRGIMTEAVGPVTDYAFNFLGFEKLVFSNAVGNLASRRVKEKTGAKYIETKPAKFVNPKYTEQEIWELEKDDWLRLRT